MKRVLTIYNGIKTTTKVRYFIAGFFQVPGMLINELLFGKSIETRDVEIEKARWSLIGYVVATIFVVAATFNSNNANIGTVVSTLIVASLIIIIKKAYNNYKLKKYFNL